MNHTTSYDAIIIGGGHNGLVAACYLGLAGLRVLVLEKNDELGGATRSIQLFPGIDARVSAYSYLVSLLPAKILSELGILFTTRQRTIASYTPVKKQGSPTGLLISNVDEAVTRQSFLNLCSDEREYQRYCKLQQLIELFAQKIWPTLLAPLPSKEAIQKQFTTSDEKKIWEYMVEKPLSGLIEDYLTNDTVRGAVFTDAKIGVLTHPDDPSLLQNRTFLYHTIGQGTGEWRVPVGGMGALVDALIHRAQGTGVTFRSSCEVTHVDPRSPVSEVHALEKGYETSFQARYVLFNTSSDIANRCLPGVYAEQQVDGSVFKINMLLKHLPEMKDPRVSVTQAFTGTLHINESYENMKLSYKNASSAQPMDAIPGEVYCHSLTDPSILSEDLQQMGYHTLTLFGLDVPYNWFANDNVAMRELVTRKYLYAINQFVKGDISDCMAVDANGKMCLEAKSPLDLEHSLGLPRGNIFHGNLSWPFAEKDAQSGTWGVETAYENVYMCGSSALRGGAVSGIPGHNAAMKVLGRSG